MRHLNIQIQPERVPSLDMSAAKGAIEFLATDKEIVAGFEITEGNDEGPYVNFTFAAKDPAKLWERIRKRVLKAPSVGSMVSRSSIVVCEGQDGWDNYILLHHFDAKFELDSADEL